MRATITMSDNNELTLHVDASDELESIAIRKWWEQITTLPNNARAMPERHFKVSYPKFS